MEYGRCGGNFGFESTDVLMHFEALPGPAVEFDNANVGRMPTCVLLLRGGQGGESSGQTHCAIGVMVLTPFLLLCNVRCVISP